MLDQMKEAQRIKAAYDLESEACQQALSNDDFAELDRIDRRVRQLMAYYAVHGWRVNVLPAERGNASRKGYGGRTHG